MRRYRRNPLSTGTKIAIGVGMAAAAGVGIALVSKSVAAAASPVPLPSPTPAPVIPPTASGFVPTQTGGSQFTFSFQITSGHSYGMIIQSDVTVAEDLQLEIDHLALPMAIQSVTAITPGAISANIPFAPSGGAHFYYVVFQATDAFTLDNIHLAFVGDVLALFDVTGIA